MTEKEKVMRGLNMLEVAFVAGGENDFPQYPGPSREEVERQFEMLKEILDEQARRNALPLLP